MVCAKNYQKVLNLKDVSDHFSKFSNNNTKFVMLCYLTFMHVVLFSCWYCCDNIHHHLGYEPLSEEEFVNHLRKLTNKNSKLFCFHHSTNQHIVYSESEDKVNFILKKDPVENLYFILQTFRNSVQEIYLIQVHSTTKPVIQDRT